MQLKFIILFLAIATSGTYAQNISRSELIRAEWFADNDNFYTSDTVYLINMKRFETDYKTLSERHVKAFYNNFHDVETFTFKRKGQLYVSGISTSFCGNLSRYGAWNWMFDKNLQILRLNYDGKTNAAFRILEKQTKTSKWEYEVEQGRPTKFEADLVILKLCRIKP